MAAVIRAACAAGALAIGGCTLITDSFATNDFSGDEFPIQVETASGAVRLGVRQAGEDDRAAILDVMSPVTVLDPGPTASPSVYTASLTLLGLDAPGGTPAIPRAVLSSAQAVSLHPCADDVAPCLVGPAQAPSEYGAIIGAESLAGDAVRLRLGDDQIFLLADIGGGGDVRTRACDGVFSSPYRGGGTMLVGGTERSFGGRRIALATCLGDRPEPDLAQGYRGADMLFVLTSSIGPSLIGETAYGRYVDACDPDDVAVTCPPALEALTATASVNLPSGPVTGRVATIPRLALVASAVSTSRAACRQVYANHFMAARDCKTSVPRDVDCPCDDATSCDAPAIVHLAPAAGIPFLVIADDDPTLQALRTELRPNQAEVDGLLGTDAIRTAEIDVDYPHNRLLARCVQEGCVTRPQITDRNDRPTSARCLAGTPPGPAFPLPE